jgi:hydrogenase expression/formation protein HypE
MKESGKIGHNAFEDIIYEKCGYLRKEVRTGPGFGIDVAIIDLPGGLSMALTSDPLSLIPSLGLQESAWLSVHLMANDMATTGCSPMYAQFVLNLPANFSSPDLKTYWHHIHTYCKEINISITGGHTGFIEGQNSTVAGGGTLVTIAPKEQMLVSKNAQSSNVILATKQCAISSSAILSMSFPETVKNKLGNQVYEEGCALFYQTSSLKDALSAAGSGVRHPEITAMHDVTEGGMLGAIYELAVASENGAIVYNDCLPIGETQKQICNLFSIDPRFTIGAGSMIIAVKNGSENEVINRLKKQQVGCTIVGELTEKEKGITIIENDEKKALPYLQKDPYWNAFFEAYKRGWK